jgi:hypothetical protein
MIKKQFSNATALKRRAQVIRYSPFAMTTGIYVNIAL